MVVHWQILWVPVDIKRHNERSSHVINVNLNGMSPERGHESLSNTFSDKIRDTIPPTPKLKVKHTKEWRIYLDSRFFFYILYLIHTKECI